MNFTAILLLIGAISALAPYTYAQNNAFGARLGLSIYQYRTDYAQFFARIGGEVGAIGRIELFSGRKSHLHHAIMPGFGYLMGHSRLLLDSAIYISPLTGRPLTGNAQAHTYTHFLYLQALWRISFDNEGALAIAGGPQLLRLLGQSLMLEYETPDGQPIQEWNRVALSDVEKVIPTWIANISLLGELRFREGLNSDWYLYIQTIHQVNRFLWPTGVLIGVAWLRRA
ncbi:MAG: hypothetical protein N2253_05530 [Bacteroidia bacterium]|nr:hypothetical protein [Bacteroidia bacterium]MCX7764334.1 hypothetical protein [Bacteroidia bacterium]MDW8056948.1 hypothetical protein [Bacteroidia bacterium]